MRNKLLERHLYKGVKGETVPGNEVFAISLEFQCLTVILTDQVGETGLCATDSSTNFRRHFHCSFRGIVSHFSSASGTFSPGVGLYEFEYGESLALKSEGVAGLMLYDSEAMNCRYDSSETNRQ